MPEAELQAPAQITAERALAVVDYRAGYQGLINSFRAVANSRRIAITSADVDETAGTARYFIAKLLSPNVNRDGRNVRRFGSASLGPLLGVLGVKLVVVDDPEAIARYTSRLPTRNESCVHNAGMHADSVHIVLSGKFMRKIRRKAGENSRKNLGKRLRRRLARAAANARWEKVRARDAARTATKAAKRRAPA